MILSLLKMIISLFIYKYNEYTYMQSYISIFIFVYSSLMSFSFFLSFLMITFSFASKALWVMDFFVEVVVVFLLNAAVVSVLVWEEIGVCGFD